MEKLFSTDIIRFLAFIAVMSIWAGCKKDDEGIKNPSIVSGPDSAVAGGIVILEGRDLAEVRSIVFEAGNTPASFNPVFNNPNAILFRVPDTALGGPTKIIITNSAGKQIAHPIVVVTPAVIESASLTDYVAGMQITLKGSNLKDVTEVALVDILDQPTGQNATIVTQERKELVIAMPASADARVRLKITNSSSTSISKMYFVNIENATPIFTDFYAAKMENWSWGGGVYAITTDEKVMGTSSLRLNLTAASKGAGTRIVNQTLIPFGNKENVSFWIKGADVPVDYSLALGKSAGENVKPQPFTVPANGWTYVTFPLQIWKSEGMTSAWSVVLQLQSANGKVTYLDNLVFN